MSFGADLRRTVHRRPGGRRRVVTSVAAALAMPFLLAAAGRSASPVWTTRAPLPAARTEVAAATVAGRIAVVGGMAQSGNPTRDAWAYEPVRNRWRALPRLVEPVHHPTATGDRGRLYVVGGYTGPGRATTTAAVLPPGARRWTRLPPLPEPRAAAGAAVVGRRLYVVGGVARGGLARRAFVLELGRPTRWRTITGPTPREHLAVVALGGRVYAIAGRRAGIDTNLTLVEALDPRTGRWNRVPPLPEARGGTGAAVAGGRIVSVGGEEPAGTIASVFVYDPKRRLWQRLPDLPTPRHGLGVAAIGKTVYAVAGGPQPGLFVSRANESLGIG
jgi:N-acetylneuraminic acid mutarotase